MGHIQATVDRPHCKVMAATEPTNPHAALFRAMDVGMVVCEVADRVPSLSVIDANDATRVIDRPGLPARPTPGSGFESAFPALHGTGVEGFLAGVANSGVADAIEVTLGRGESGATVLSIRGLPLEGRRVAMVVEDATSRHQRYAELLHLAHHDSLTGLANRALFLEALGESMNQALAADGRVAVAVLDLDRFKGVNDMLGHEHGDTLLQEVANRLARVPGAALAARLGGDEFAVVAPLAAASAQSFVARIAAAVARPFDIRGIPVLATASIGAAICPEHARTPDELLHHADVAMYAAKRSGRSTAVYRPEDDMYVLRQRHMLSDLRRAIQEDHLQLHYQPKVDVGASTVVGVEALLRWNHPEWGEVSPAEFVPIAESTGLIGPLTMWVLDHCGDQCRTWVDSGTDLGVSANISARNLYDPSLVRLLTRVLERGVPDGRLTLELTETQMVEDLPMARQLLRRIRDMGIRLSIDDFGTGYSSLAYLNGLPLDELKIDRSFCGDPGGSRSTRIVQSIIGLGHDLGLQVVAEGVESSDAWDWLADLGCDEVQGHHVSVARPAADLENWLSEADFAFSGRT